MDTKEIDGRLGEGVRNIHASPLLLAGVLYKFNEKDSQGHTIYEESEHGTLRPDYTHGYLNWEALYYESSDWEGNPLPQPVEKWSKEVYFFRTEQERDEAIAYLEKFKVN